MRSSVPAGRPLLAGGRQQQEEDEEEEESPRELRTATFQFASDACNSTVGDDASEDEDAASVGGSSASSSDAAGGGAAAASSLQPKRDIHRCHSAVDSSRVPVHALFLQQQQQQQQQRRSCGATRRSQHELQLNDAVYDGEEQQQQQQQQQQSGDQQKKKRSLTEKFSFLARKSIDTAAEKAIRGIRPNREQLRRWGTSFDSLLNDKYGLALFRAFLKTEYSDENIEFWVACEEYRGLSGQKKQAVKAQKIYNEFVAFQAPREVNLDSTTRLATIKAMGSADKHLFELAQKRIQALMEKDSYQRFLRSDVYQSHVRDAQSGGGRSGTSS